MTDLHIPPLFLADNLALDFINTEYGVGDQRQDALASGQCVAHWLAQAGLLPEPPSDPLPEGLLPDALALRNCSRAVVMAAMHGVEADAAVVNQVLEAGRPASTLVWEATAKAFRISAQPSGNSSASLLWPVAEAFVNLVTSDTFAFVRQCKAQDCILLFHDVSKSHRRRWCSMATCGNRMKVAAFRARKKPE